MRPIIQLILVFVLTAVSHAAEARLDDQGLSPYLREYHGEWGSFESGFIPDRHDIIEGEPLFITFHVRNTGVRDLTFPMGGDIRGSVRHNRFGFIGRDSTDHAPLSDPHGYSHMGGLMDLITLPPGDTYQQTLLLNHWVSLPDLELSLGDGPPFSISITGFCTLTLGDDRERNEPVNQVPISSAFLLSFDRADEQSQNRVIDRFAKLTLGPDLDDRKKGWQGLSFLGNRAAVTVLLGELTNIQTKRVHPELLMRALSGCLHDERVIPALAALVMDDGRPAGTSVACDILGGSSHPDAKKALFHLVRHQPERLNADIIHILKRYPKDEVLPLLDQLEATKPTKWIQTAILDTKYQLGVPFDRNHVLPMIRAWSGEYGSYAMTRDWVRLFSYGDVNDARVLVSCLREEKNEHISSVNQAIVHVVKSKGGPDQPYQWLDKNRVTDPKALARNKATLDACRQWAKGGEAD